MEMYDYDNMTKVVINKAHVAKLKPYFDRGEIIFVDGGGCAWEDALDIEGSLGLDEDAYEQCKAILGL